LNSTKTSRPQKTKVLAKALTFEEAARELGCDEDEAHFEEKLKKVAAHKLKEPPPKIIKNRAFTWLDKNTVGLVRQYLDTTP